MGRSRSTENADPKVVVLVHPDGTEYSSNSPTEINRLHYGQGYTFRDVSDYHEALAHLGDEAAVLSLPSHEAPPGVVTITLTLADDVTVVDQSTSTD